MAFWQVALILLVVLWAGQAAGMWLQMRHYRDVMRTITQSWPDGYVGASAARGYFGKGVIAIVVASPDEQVRQVFLMEGRSVFAKFREQTQDRGVSLGSLATGDSGTATKGRRQAVAGAVAQIRAALSRRETSVATPLAA